MYGAEVDCIDEDGTFLEVKTQFKAIGHGRNFQTKAMKWWLQSALGGIRTIIAGIRDDNGIVERIQKVEVSELKRRAERWDSNKCLVFLYSFLAKVKRILDSVAEGSILVAERRPNNYAFKFRVMDPFEGSKNYSFLTEEFKLNFV